MNWLKEEVDRYYDWLKQNTFVREEQGTGWGVISMPFTGLFNDNIAIYAKREGNNILLSDDGDTIASLQNVGVSFSSPHRKAILERISRNFGVKVLKNGEITKSVTYEQFPQGKHDMLQAIMEISDLRNISSRSVNSLFKEDVRAFFKDNRINVNPQMMLPGKSGINFTFDYMLSNFDSECLVQTFNVLDKPRLAQFLFGMDEVKENRQKTTDKTLSAVTIINDVDNKLKEEFSTALTSRNYAVLLWSERNLPKFKNNFKKFAA
jgi:hypothetical protein